MHSLTTRTLTTLLLTAPILAQGENPPAQPTAALGYVQSTNQGKPTDTPASLVEQALYAEEHERDFARATELFQRALDAARQANDATQLDRATKGFNRVLARQRGAPIDAPQDDPILCSIARCLRYMGATLTARNGATVPGELDIRLYGSAAVPWLEKAATQQFDLCGQRISGSVERCVRVLAGMGLPEADAALERLAKSTDPLTRRAVVGYCDPGAQRSLLIAALQDATASVRETALLTLTESNDRALVKVIEPEARRGEWVALRWLAFVDATQVLAIAADAKLDESVRRVALNALSEGKVLKPTTEAVDALLGISRSTSNPTLAAEAMQMLADFSGEFWRPLSDELRKKLESALTTTPDAYPQPVASYALLTVGGGPAIAASARQLLAALDAMREGSPEQGALVQRVESRLNQLQEDAFPYVARAFAELPLGDEANSLRNRMLWAYGKALERLAAKSSLPDFARCAEGLDDRKFEFYAGVVGGWLRARSSPAQRPMPPLDKEWLPLLRRMATAANEHTRAAAMLGFGLTRDPSVLPDLISASGDPSDRVRSEMDDALGLVITADVSRARRVLEDAMDAYVRRNGKHSVELAWKVRLLDSGNALQLAERYWAESEDVDLRRWLYRAVCERVQGEKGNEFLLRRFSELPAEDSSMRSAAIRRFGHELYEPALDALEGALSDPDAEVRKAARGAFEAFKAQREALAEFAAWKATQTEARQTIDELVKLTESANVDVVIGAVKALGALKASATYPTLVRLLERKEPELKAAVRAALDKLGE